MQTKVESAAVDPLGPSAADDARELRRQLDEEAGHDLGRLVEIARRAGEEFERNRPQRTDEAPGGPTG